MRWYWYVLFYSLLGFFLEVAFARATRSSKQDRKCFLFLPLCPVYGLGALAILLLPAPILSRPILLFLLGGLAATGAEYAAALFYERVLGVQFWDYSHLPGNLGGRVCLWFSAMWGLLALGLVYLVHPAVLRLTAHIPAAFFLPSVFLLSVDALATCLLLRRTGSTDSLRWYLRLSPLSHSDE